VLVHAQRELRVIGCAWKATGLGERAVDQDLRDAVIRDDEEADVLQRAPDFLGRRVERGGLAARNGPRSITGIMGDRFVSPAQV